VICKGTSKPPDQDLIHFPVSFIIVMMEKKVCWIMGLTVVIVTVTNGVDISIYMYYNQNPTQILTLKFSKNDGVRNHKNTNYPPN
jgi:hypothetical protein